MRLPEQNQFKITLHHSGRNCLATILLSLCTLGVLTSLTLISVGAAIHTSVEHYRPVLDAYDGAYLSFILGGLGLVGIVIHSLLIFLLTEFINPQRSDHLGRTCMMLVIFATLTMVAGIICFAHIREIHTSFQDGIRYGIKNYKNVTAQKSAIDEIQIQYKCCGLKGYRDWFNVAWVNETFADKTKIQKHTKHGLYLPDDVPFSCCDTSAARPCIHEGVHTNNLHYNYDHVRQVTVYTAGCLENVKKSFGPGLLFIMGGLVCSIAVMDYGLATGTRILYTSLLSAMKRGDEYGPGIGIIWPGRILVYDSSTEIR